MTVTACDIVPTAVLRDKLMKYKASLFNGVQSKPCHLRLSEDTCMMYIHCGSNVMAKGRFDQFNSIFGVIFFCVLYSVVVSDQCSC